MLVFTDLHNLLSMNFKKAVELGKIPRFDPCSLTCYILFTIPGAFTSRCRDTGTKLGNKLMLPSRIVRVMQLSSKTTIFENGFAGCATT